MQVIVSTHNKAKNQAIKEVFNEVFDDVEIISQKFSSDISEQPLSEIEGINGAINRAKNAQLKFIDADYCIGMEGYVDSNQFGMFLAGAVAIINKDGNIGIGLSAKILLPTFIKNKIDQGQELGPLMQHLMNDTNNNIRHNSGTSGILTNDLYTRIKEFEDATKCALARFISPDFYNKK